MSVIFIFIFIFLHSHHKKFINLDFKQLNMQKINNCFLHFLVFDTINLIIFKNNNFLTFLRAKKKGCEVEKEHSTTQRRFLLQDEEVSS